MTEGLSWKGLFLALLVSFSIFCHSCGWDYKTKIEAIYNKWNDARESAETASPQKLPRFLKKLQAIKLEAQSIQAPEDFEGCQKLLIRSMNLKIVALQAFMDGDNNQFSACDKESLLVGITFRQCMRAKGVAIHY